MPDPEAVATRPAAGADRLFADPGLRRIAVVVILGSVMSILDTTIVNVAIETLGRDFRTSIATIQWVTTGYLLALGIVIPVSGWAMERFGTKRMWLLSLGLFVCGSVACGLSWSTGSLITFRVIQGLGGGMIMPIGQAVLARAAGPRRIGRMMAVLGVPTLLAPVLGPVIGGLIVTSVTWRWIFFVNVPIGVLALVLSFRFMPGGDRQDAGRLDLVGTALLSPGLAGLTYGLSEAGSGQGLTSPAVLVSVLVGAALIGAFALRAWRIDRPLLDVRLFADRLFAVCNVVILIFGAALYAAMILLPLYYQVVRGQSALNAGLLMVPQGVGAMLSMPLGGRLTDKIGPGPVIPIGMVLFIGGTIAYTQLGPATGYLWLMAWLFVRGLGMGWTIMPANAAAYANLTRSLVPRATTTLNIVMRLGGAFGTALVAVVLQRQIDDRLPHLSGILAQPAPAGGAALPLDVARPLSSAFGYSFWIVVGMSMVGLVASLLLPRRRAVDPEATAHTAGEEDLEAAVAGVPLPVVD